jgi:hypothetical protein
MITGSLHQDGAAQSPHPRAGNDPHRLFFARGREGGEERVGVDFLDQRRQHAVGNVGHEPDVVALERLQHHLVPGFFAKGFGRHLSIGSRH